MRVLRKAVQAAGRTVRHAQKHADSRAPEPYAGRYAARELEGVVRPLPFKVRRETSRRDKKEKKMASCKNCGAPVKINRPCPYCKTIAYAWEHPEYRPEEIPEVHSIAEFFAALSGVMNKHLYEPYSRNLVRQMEQEINELIFYTKSEYVPIEFRYLGGFPSEIRIEMTITNI